ncbi:MAG TPA: hypothetical protein VF734_09775 [Pseudonocardiaceae bacterium]
MRDNERAANVTESLNPQAHVNRSAEAAYWAGYGRALARITGHQQNLVMTLRRGGPQLRGMAYRAGLPV